MLVYPILTSTVFQATWRNAAPRRWSHRTDPAEICKMFLLMPHWRRSNREKCSTSEDGNVTFSASTVLKKNTAKWALHPAVAFLLVPKQFQYTMIRGKIKRPSVTHAAGAGNLEAYWKMQKKVSEKRECSSGTFRQSKERSYFSQVKTQIGFDLTGSSSGQN